MNMGKDMHKNMHHNLGNTLHQNIHKQHTRKKKWNELSPMARFGTIPLASSNSRCWSQPRRTSADARLRRSAAARPCGGLPRW